MQGSCHLTCIPLRAETSGKSELVTQLLFGETYHVHGQEGSWYKILTDYDSYHCWLNESQLNLLETERTGDVVYLESLWGTLSNEREKINIPCGAELVLNAEGKVLHRGTYWKLEGKTRKPAAVVNRDTMVNDAYQFENAPYLWGGRTAFGMDCSGLTQLVYKLNGVKLPRDAYQQATVGNTLSFLDETMPGDLVFFDNEDGKIVHVGILLSTDRIIHASGHVRIDKIDQMGIFNTSLGKYTHKLRLIKKVV